MSLVNHKLPSTGFATSTVFTLGTDNGIILICMYTDNNQLHFFGTFIQCGHFDIQFHWTTWRPRETLDAININHKAVVVQLIMKSLSSGSPSNMKDFHLLPIPLSITPKVPQTMLSPSQLMSLATIAAAKQHLPPKYQKTPHSLSPTPTSLPPQKKQKITTSPNSTLTPDSLTQTIFSTLLKKKHEECIKDMTRLSDKWTIFNAKFKNITIAKMFRKKDSNTTLYLYHFHCHLYNRVTKELFQEKTTLPFGTFSLHYHTLKDQVFLMGLQALLRSQKRKLRAKPNIFIPSPSPSGRTGGSVTMLPPPSVLAAPPPPVRPAPVILPLIHLSSTISAPLATSPPLVEQPYITPPVILLSHLPPVEPPVASSSCQPQVLPIHITPLPKHPLMEDEPEVNREGLPSWVGSQPSPLMGKWQESPQHVTMPFKHE